jgi:cytochrome c553
MRLYRHLLTLTVIAILMPPAVAGEPSGEKIFREVCARCHGPRGEGSNKVRQKLEGDRSAAQLAGLIGKTMPEDNPGSLPAAEVAAVAEYVFEQFYSPIAQERNRPARVELSRLTVKQYRNALADLVGSFRAQPKWGDTRGLKGEYFAARNFRGDRRVVDRVDPQVAIDFGTDSPVPGKIEAHEFSIRWTGSLMAPETGEYEFVVRTEHAARLWVNDAGRALIDAWVKSGKDTEYRATLYLIAGRIYPVRLEYSKAKQGVDDSKKQKDKPPPVKSSIALLWRRPQRPLEPIPSRSLSPLGAPESYVCSTPFPPDDRSYGWERGTTVSKAWDSATTDGALELADYIARRLPELAGVRDDTPDRAAKLRAFSRRFAERAFRRPLNNEQSALIDRQFEATQEIESAVKRAVLIAVKSPRFLYREAGRENDAYAVAERLSFGLWDTIPSPELLSAAAAGQLANREQVTRQAQVMLGDPRAKAKLRDFLLTWLRADVAMDLAKDPKAFPGFDAALIADLRTSLELILEQSLATEAADFRQLLLGEEWFVNGRLAKFYGINLPAQADFTKVKRASDRRAGVLTHPYLMTSFAHSKESSPIHRGVFLARGVLGLSLRPPPEAVAPLAPDLHPNLTTRERVTVQTQPATCMTCHAVINPLGFTLEHFDAVGRYRDRDHEKPVDATGSYRTRSGKTVTLKGAGELARFVVTSDEAHEAFVEQMFHHLVQQPARAYGAGTLDELRRSFANNNFNMRRLAVEIMAATALHGRK